VKKNERDGVGGRAKGDDNRYNNQRTALKGGLGGREGGGRRKGGGGERVVGMEGGPRGSRQ